MERIPGTVRSRLVSERQLERESWAHRMTSSRRGPFSDRDSDGGDWGLIWAWGLGLGFERRGLGIEEEERRREREKEAGRKEVLARVLGGFWRLGRNERDDME